MESDALRRSSAPCLEKTESMYPLSMPYRKVRSRLKNLIKDGYSSEALVSAVFTAERLLRRTLVQLV